MSLKIYGASDDLVKVEGHFQEEYDVTGDQQATFEVRERDGAGGCWVRLTYSEMTDDGEGGWSAHVGLLGEGRLIPWDITIGHHPRCAYSVRVTIDCPYMVTIERVVP